MDRLSNDVMINQWYKISITYMYNSHNSSMNDRRNGERYCNIPIFVICLTPTRISRTAVWIEITSYKEEGLE
jgi:hypothetical protein